MTFKKIFREKNTDFNKWKIISKKFDVALKNPKFKKVTKEFYKYHTENL